MILGLCLAVKNIDLIAGLLVSDNEMSLTRKLRFLSDSQEENIILLVLLVIMYVEAAVLTCSYGMQ